MIPWDKGCVFGHSDGMVRFINNNTVLISGFYEQVDSKFKDSLLKPLEKAKLNCEWLRCAKKESESNIAYINFLQTEDIILIPSMDRKEDDEALEQLATHFPNYSNSGKIRQINLSEIVRHGGALNCISWTTKENNVPNKVYNIA